jgi:hypothetical protein
LLELLVFNGAKDVSRVHQHARATSPHLQ